jgi:hypothetical protein
MKKNYAVVTSPNGNKLTFIVNSKSTIKKIVSLSLITIGISFNAFADDRIGNGDGDNAFALQKLSEANPNMTPIELLTKAWDESSGRIPEVNHPIKNYAGSDFFSIFPMGAQSYELSLNGGISESPKTYYTSMPFVQLSHKLSKTTNYYKEYNNNITEGSYQIIKEIKDDGPLIKTEKFYRVDPTINYGFFELKRNSIDNSGLSFTSSSKDMNFNGPTIEYRAYNENIVIYTIRMKYEKPEYNSNVIPSCPSCYKIGYVWWDKKEKNNDLEELIMELKF